MATHSDTITHILDVLGEPNVFRTRAMFGEYALYADGRVVALVCDDTLYVKVRPESEMLRELCALGEPYPGARPHYRVTLDELETIQGLANILRAVASALPVPTPRSRRTP